MKILHFHPDGKMARKFVKPLMDAEKNSGFESRLVVDRNPFDESVAIPYDMRLVSLAQIPLTVWKILCVFVRFSPDVIVSHNSRSSFIPLLLAKLLRIGRRIYFNHGAPYIAYRGLVRRLLWLLDKMNTGLATEVLTVSKDMLDILTASFPKVPMKYLHYGSASGIELSDFAADRYDRAAWRARYGFNASQLIAVFVGRPERRKGFELVLRIWFERFYGVDISLVLCGPCENDVIRSLGTKPKNIIALGFVENVPEVLASSDLLILPSFHEGLSYACIEAQASSLLVVANDIPGIRCVVESGVNGFLVQDNELNQYAEIIQKIYDDKSRFDDIRRQARFNAEKFSRKKFMPDYIKFLGNRISS